MMGEKAEMVAGKPRVGIFGAAFDTRNMGVNALAMGTLKCILQQYPDAEIFHLSYGRTGSTLELRVGRAAGEYPICEYAIF